MNKVKLDKLINESKIRHSNNKRPYIIIQKPKPQINKSDIEIINKLFKNYENINKPKLGRPINVNSKHQIKLRKLAVLKELGIFALGRPRKNEKNMTLEQLIEFRISKRAEFKSK